MFVIWTLVTANPVNSLRYFQSLPSVTLQVGILCNSVRFMWCEGGLWSIGFDQEKRLDRILVVVYNS